MSQGPADASYGQVAVSLGFVTPERVQDCVEAQAKMRQMGIDIPLGEVLSRKGYLTAQQQSAVLKKMGVQTSPIPGYTLMGKIGQGGMGVVYKAVQTSVNRTVAIKILSNAATKDKTYIARFLGEAQAAASLSHKNLIAAIDVGFSNGYYYFVMEFVTGKSCRELLTSKGVFSEKEALDVALQMSEVLEHIHQHKMVHRDIKPENILLTTEGQVKLCDLGLAKSTSTMEQSLTQEGLTVGTPYFMSPEQIRGDKDVDIRADLYSLGATMFFLATGKPPYAGQSAAETMGMHLNAPVPDLRKSADVSDDFAAVVFKLMAKDRAQRYPTPTELLDDLRKLKQGSAPHHARQHQARAHAAHKEKVSVRLSKAKSPPWWIFAAGAAAVLLLATLAFFLFRPKPEKEVVVVREQVLVPEKRAEPAPSAEPKDDPSKTAEAARVFASAYALYQQERWSDTLLELRKLGEGPLAALQYTREKGATIGEMKGACERKLKDAAETESRLADTARAALRDGRWKDAYAALKTLVDAGKSSFRADYERAGRELKAQEAVDELRAARDGAQWAKVLTRAIESGQSFAGTETLKAHEVELKLMVGRALTEDRVLKALAAAHAKAVTGDWVEVSRQLADVEVHRETDAYRGKQEEIRDLRERMAKANEKLAEEAAAGAWVQALQRYNSLVAEKKYEPAAEALRDYAKEHGSTAAYRAHAAEIDAKIADAGKKRKDDREAEARKLWPLVQSDLKTGKLDSAYDGIQRLLGELSDTQTGRAQESKLRGYKAQLEKDGKTGSPVLIEMDFEDLPGVWQTGNGAQGRNSPEEPFQGRRCAKLEFGIGGRAYHPIAGLRPGVELITFYARTRGKTAATLQFSLWDNGQASTASFAQTFTAGPEWRLVQLKALDFKPYNDYAKMKKWVEWPQVTHFQIQPSSGDYVGEGTELLIDSLRVIAAPLK